MLVDDPTLISESCPAAECRADGGAVLVLVLLTGALVAAVAAMMLAIVEVELFGAGSYRDAAEAFFAADGALEASVDDLARQTDWTPVLAGSARPTWSNSSSVPSTAFAGPLNLLSLTSALQTEAAGLGLGAGTPSWTLFAHASIGALWPDAGPVRDIYVVVWVADDESDDDGNAAVDSNNTIQIRAEAYGRRQSRRAVEAVISRVSSGIVRQMTWREVR